MWSDFTNTNSFFHTDISSDGKVQHWFLQERNLISNMDVLIDQ